MRVEFFYKEDSPKWHTVNFKIDVIPRIGETVEIVFPDFIWYDTFKVINIIHVPKQEKIEIELKPNI